MNGTFRFSPRPNRASEIRWREWGDKPFEEAAEQGKLVLLSISAVWCHWCHVMDETTYSDPEVIELINRDFIPVRVDNDRHPEINRRYNQGGWPTTAFLSPQGALLAGTTYLPPQQMREVLRRFRQLWREQGDEINLQVEQALAEAGKQGELAPPSPSGTLHPGIRDEVWRAVSRAQDREHGGLGSAPKFPMFEALDLALDLHLDRDSLSALAWAELTARRMLEGGVYDKVEGGLFRYSTTPDWSVPHYEKMLMDNARFALLLLRLYALTGDRSYSGGAAEVLAYLGGTLSDGKGRFFGSQDADEEYYSLDREGRGKAKPPPVDRTLYADGQAVAAAAFLKGGAVLDAEDLRGTGLAALQVLASLHDRERGLPHYHDGWGGGGWGLLEDQVAALEAFLCGYQHLEDPEWLERARRLAGLVLRYYRDGGGALLDMDGRFAPARVQPQRAELEAASGLARSLIILSELDGDTSYGDASRSILEEYADSYHAYGFHAAAYARAVDLYLAHPTVIRMRGWGEAGAMRRIILSSPLPRLIYIPDGNNINENEADGISGKDGDANEVHALICRGSSCESRIAEAAALAQALRISIDRRDGGKAEWLRCI
jgi:uncharacterized protein YyaL (SSP411 family)